MFRRRKDIIRDLPVNDGKASPLMRVMPWFMAGAFAIGTALDIIKKSDDEPEKSTDHGFVNPLTEDPENLYCKAPDAVSEFFNNTFNMKKYFTDAAFYDFWNSPAEDKAISFSFEKENYYIKDNEDFFDNMPQGVIDNPSVRFILSGHASKEGMPQFSVIQGGLREPTKKELDDYKLKYELFVNYNRALVDKRLDAVEKKLLALGVEPDRIERHNYGFQENRKSVDMEVCGVKPEMVKPPLKNNANKTIDEKYDGDIPYIPEEYQ